MNILLITPYIPRESEKSNKQTEVELKDSRLEMYFFLEESGHGLFKA